MPLYNPTTGSGGGTGQLGMVISYDGNGYGSTNNKIRRFTNTTGSVTDITYADSSTNGGSFTINTTGTYAISYTDNRTSGGFIIGISVNSGQTTTSIFNMSYANGNRGEAHGSGANLPTNVSTTLQLTAGDVVRAHTDGGANDTGNVFFSVTRLR